VRHLSIMVSQATEGFNVITAAELARVPVVGLR